MLGWTTEGTTQIPQPPHPLPIGTRNNKSWYNH